MITKQHLIDEIVVGNNFSKPYARDVLDAAFCAIAASLRAGHEVRIHGFGTFSTSDRKATTGRNPRTGEPVDIPARKAIRFKASARLSGAVQ